ncbi:MAG TPA: hypothetical protein VFH33_01850 [Candidatus Krumholzibacteria bacterium]|nr:hypothetical protein [Candidatus Krumholzibacteria bacterium]
MRRSTSQAWWSDLAKTGIFCAALAAMVSAVGVRAAEQTASNIDLMQKLTAEVVKELQGKFAPSLNGRAVQLKPANTSEDYYFVTNVLREELMRLGIRVIEPATPLSAPATPTPVQPAATSGAAPAGTTPATQSTLPSTAWSGTHTQAPAPADTSRTSNGTTGEKYVLTYQNVVFNVKYVDSHRSFVVGGKRVERHAAVRMMATLTDPADGRVVWVGESARESNDEIDYGKAMEIEQGSYTFNKPVVPSAGWGKFVEPVFVTGIIVGLIYLFFSNQSDN